MVSKRLELKGLFEFKLEGWAAGRWVVVFFDLLVAEIENGLAAIDGRATELLARDDRAPEGRASLKHRAIDAILRGVEG